MTDKPPVLPGDPTRTQRLEEILRVDHAGEYGAVRIYEGQLAMLGASPTGDAIRNMRDQERAHLQAFDKLLPAHRVRPTLLTPLWHVAGFALGAATAALGEKAAMACTVAVEEVIDEHYAGQIAELTDTNPALAAQLERFRVEEVEHRDHGIAAGARDVAGYELLSGAIKAGSRFAIWLSTRI